MSDAIELRASDASTVATVAIDVQAGGRLSQITIEANGEKVELLTAPPPDAPASSTGWGCFVMAPWVGRLRHGRFTHDGTPVRLDLNHEDGAHVGGGPIEPPAAAPAGDIEPSSQRHAIHGTVFARPWSIASKGESECELSCELTDGSPGSVGWPFEGTTSHRIVLSPNRLELTLTVQPAPGASFPASVGWHPWFAKPELVKMTPTSMLELDDISIPTGITTEPPPGPWDDCFTNTEPVHLLYQRRAAELVTVTSDCDHLVVYDRPSDATCVEPQSGPTNGPNLRPDVITADTPLQRTMTIAW